MEIIINSCKWQELLDVLTEVLVQNHTLTLENNILKVKSSGSISKFKGNDFSNGLGMFTMSVEMDEDLIIHFHAETPVLWCLYCLEGCFRHSDTLGNQYELKPGQFANCTFKKDERALLHFPAKRRVTFIGLCVSQSAYVAYKHLAIIPMGIKKLFEHPRSNHAYLHQGQCDIALAGCLVQICNNIKNGWISEILYEAKALEVLGLQLNQYARK